MLQLANVFLRGLTLGSKFLLIFYLAKYLEPSQLGQYGLLAGAIGYALYLLGLEFYTYTTREFVKSPKTEWGKFLKTQAILTFFIYVVCLPPLALIFFYEILPIEYIFWFYALLVFEHLTQEFNRIFVAISRPFLASIILFIRSAIWIFALIPLMIFNEPSRQLSTVFMLWLIGAVTALILSLLTVFKSGLGGWEQKADWQWIKKGLKISLPFLVSSLAIRGLFTLDRFFIESYMGLDVVAAYVLFISIGNAMVSFLDSGIFVFAYPRLIDTFAKNNLVSFAEQLRKLFRQVLVIITVFSLSSYLILSPVLKLLGRDQYAEQSWIFPWIMTALSVFCLGQVPQYALYAQNRDRTIIAGHVLSFIIFLTVTFIIGLGNKNYAVISGLNISLIFGALWNLYFLKRKLPNR